MCSKSQSLSNEPESLSFQANIASVNRFFHFNWEFNGNNNTQSME